MKKADLADGMEKMLEVFLKENLSEYFFYKENNRWVDVLKQTTYDSQNGWVKQKIGSCLTIKIL